MNADRPRLLRQHRQRRLDLRLDRHHQIRQLVDDDDDHRQHTLGVHLFRRRLRRGIRCLDAYGSQRDLGPRRIPERLLPILNLAIEVRQVARTVGL
jgi:hypothetical protein